ncbi:MAG: chromosomal replication initiator protein DnaA [Chloroflexi bacterium]|nr:chromosomal replication initiator protein DnaA [Chloroflexota bacterium]
MNARQIWQAALAELQKQIPKTEHDTWLKHTKLTSTSKGEYVVAVPSTFAKEWLEHRLLRQIRNTLSIILGQKVQVSVVVSESVERKRARDPRSIIPSLDEAQQTRVDESDAQPPDDLTLAAETIPDNRWKPDPKYTFAAFIVGNNNRLAHAAAEAVAKAPATTYNPLFIYGGVGLGKTHLLHAIAHRVLRDKHKVLCVTSETFTNEIINAIMDRRTDDFRNRYRNIDVLLIDDIQFIGGKESTQEEFFHTFNALYAANKQIVVSSDRPPKSIVTLEERLRSRFEWGLIADIQAPDFETRVAILRSKAERQRMVVSPEVLEFIARKVQRNIRELEGALNRVVAYAKLNNRVLTPEAANTALSDLLTNKTRRLLTPVKILETVGKYYQVDIRALRGKVRSKDIVLPRQVAMYLIREETSTPLLEIGRELGGRDHSTVLHAYDKIQTQIDIDDDLRSQILEIRELLYARSR